MSIYADYRSQVTASETLEQLMHAMDGACEKTIQLLEEVDEKLAKIKLVADTCMQVPSFSGFMPMASLKKTYFALAEYRLQVTREFRELQAQASAKADAFTTGPVN